MNFFEKYFIFPAKNPGKYNAINTVTYILIFILSAFALYKYLIKKFRKINKDVFISAVPFMLIGIFYRILVDTNVLSPSLLTVTPGSWVMPFILWISSLELFSKISKDPFDATFFLGIIILSPLLLFIINYLDLRYIAIYGLFFVFLYFLLHYNLQILLPIAGEFLDSIATYIAISRNFSEEHIVSGYLINMSPLLYVIIKILTTIIVVISIDKLCKDQNLKNYLYYVIFVIGFGPGSRNMLLLSIK